MLRTIGLAAAVVFGSAAGNLAAQEWAEKMFNTMDHDFGTVAMGADVVYKFEVTNLYKQDMTLLGVRSSCGCTSPSIENPIIKTHEKAYVVARFNTRTPPHMGQNGATLTVSFGAPYAAEVQVHVHGNIRGDVVFSPGSIEFGDVDEGKPGEQRLNVTYAGRSDWEISDITNDNDNFEVELNEAARAANKVSYNLVVRLKPNTPAGYIKDQLTVVTNDSRPENQRIPLVVSAHVRPEFSVTPEQLVLGDVKPGETITKKIVVRGRDPFKILNVTCGENCFEFNTDKDSKTVHFVEVTLRAGEQPCKLQTPIRIVTDRGEGHGPTCLASATVVEGKPAADSPAGASDKSTGKTAEVDTVRTASAQQ